MREFILAGMAYSKEESREISVIASNAITHFRILDMNKD